ncbi:hypothetical protein F0562_024918 [Nyssa sinensis]|uniref:BHLH domain-containing protein n=1 Tax=Nyssa sinensis TaxID=561372 RepID=A0A5J5BE25_9ASTE|nr:hypothetical protein F0562_024918 [Nyssa sinensis]
MSSRTSRSRQSGVSRITDDQINELVSQLQQLLPEIRNRHSDKKEKGNKNPRWRQRGGRGFIKHIVSVFKFQILGRV